MSKRDISAILARPIAHRGLHDRARGIIENSHSAFRAAMDGGFAIECDVQLTGDGEAVVFHDFELERLTNGAGKVAQTTVESLKRLQIIGSDNRIGTLAEMFSLVDGRVPIVCEIKSTFRGDFRLTGRVAEVANHYSGPLVIKSFDPRIVAHWHSLGTDFAVGVVGMSDYAHHEYDACTPAEKHAMANLLHMGESRPDFLSWRVRDLETAVPFLWRKGMGCPLMSWTVRTPEDVAAAGEHADQMVFEGFVP